MNKENEILVSVEGVSKKFSRSLNQSLKSGLKDIFFSLLGINQNRGFLRKDEFWAVKDVSFELRRGECIGLIGHNGAGKSTLLKMLNGLIRPDEGSIRIKGKVGALIELGAGFNPILTGRENIYVNGQLLGFTKKEIDRKLNDIIDFSEIHEFIDSPVQNYSSGMKVRLGFAIAAQMEPDVLIIDEVLAVGDVGFQVKCFNVIQKLASNSSVIFVSHSMPNIARIASKSLLLEKGKTFYYGNDINTAIRLYLNKFKGEEVIVTGKNVKFTDLTIYDRVTSIEKTIEAFHDLGIRFSLSALDMEPGEYIVVYVFFDQTLRQIASYTSDPIGLNAGEVVYRVDSVLQKINLTSGTYNFGIALYKLNNKKLEIYTYHKNIMSLSVNSKVNITNTIIEFEGKLELTKSF